MAEHIPPDERKGAGNHRGGKSGNVVDFRYTRSSSSRRNTPQKAQKPKAQTQNPHGRASHEQYKDDADNSGFAKGGGLGKDRDKGPARKRFARSGPGPRQSFAALDLGTNNCRLLIARPSRDSFTVIDAFSRVVKLGEDLTATGRLSDAAMERTLDALKVCSEKLRRRNVFLARSVATEACRRAENGVEFIERVRQETGIMLDIITAEEEARLAVLGCHILLEHGEGPAIIFDIGGGSTELVLLEEEKGHIPNILDWQSLPWGVVSLSDTVIHKGDSPADLAARYAEMRQVVRSSLAPFAARLGARAHATGLRLLGTSGTVTTLASLHLELPQYDRNVLDGLIMPSRAIRTISANLSSMSYSERGNLPCVGPGRADLLVAGCAILEGILDIWPAERLGVADRGIREGILRSLMDLPGTTGEAARRPSPENI